MTTAVERAGDKPTLANLIKRMQPEIAKVLPAQMNPERMARIATTVVRQTPALARTSPESFLGALLTASQLGLEPGGVRPGCYFVPYGNVCTFIPSWFGLVDLARRSGQVVDVWAEIVHENDTFVYTLGLDRTIERHDPPPLGQDRGKPIGVYAAAELVSGGKPFVVMTVAEVESIRSRSRASKSGPWVTDWAAMAKKVAVKQLCKWLPSSAELTSALSLDGSVRTDVGPLADVVQPTYIDGEVEDSPAIDEAPGRGGGDDQQQDAEPSSGADNPSAAGDQEPPVDVVMAGRAELAKLKQIREAEKHDAESWADFLHASIGRPVKSDKELTLDEANEVIALFNEDAEK